MTTARRWGMPRIALVTLTVAAVSGMPIRAMAQPPRQTDADAYTRYELLAPESGKFRILYDVSATTPGATEYFNPIRQGSIATDERVHDLATGQQLAFDIVNAEAARAGGVRVSDSTQQYLRVQLARPVPGNGGEGRIRIDKTYEDRASYHLDGEELVFERPLGIKRNAVVLPQGWELIACNYPSQVLQETDGRILISFWNATPAEAPLKLRARRMSGMTSGATSVRPRLVERAAQTREIVYALREPSTHAFDLYHDYTEDRVGTDHYLNVVRAGSTVSEPSGVNLDTGEPLRTEVVRGPAITRAKLAVADVQPTTEVVVFRFPAVPQGGSVRLRMSETYTDPARYREVNGELVWDRGFGRPANAVVLPRGWMLTNSTVPGVVTTVSDGRVRIDFINPRNDEIGVLITARRRAP